MKGEHISGIRTTNHPHDALSSPPDTLQAKARWIGAAATHGAVRKVPDLIVPGSDTRVGPEVHLRRVVREPCGRRMVETVNANSFAYEANLHGAQG